MTDSDRWNPYVRYTWTLGQIHAWIDQNGSWAFYDGIAWSIGNKRISPDRYDVWFYKLPN